MLQLVSHNKRNANVLIWNEWLFEHKLKWRIDYPKAHLSVSLIRVNVFSEMFVKMY
jgi:hypothetical protein